MKKTFTLILILFICASCPCIAQQRGGLNIEKIYGSAEFFPKPAPEMVHMKDGEHYCTNDDEGITMYDYLKGKKTKVLVEKSDLTEAGSDKPLQIEEFLFSEDETKLLLTTSSEHLYRNSRYSEYYVFDIKTKKMTRLSESGKQRFAEFSPDASKVAFARDNNLFIKDLQTGDEIIITRDGKLNSIINGTTDWVYEEELDIVKAFWWSPEGDKLAFMKFDESNVPEYTLVKYNGLYPENFKYKYPKSGETNSTVAVWVYDLLNDRSIKIDVGNETDQYIPRVFWTKESGKLAVLRMNRLQNQVEMLLADDSSGQSTVVWQETNKSYIEITDNLHFLDDKQRFLYTSEQDGYNHIWMFSMNGSENRQITKGNFDVAGIRAVDEKNKLIYYVSSETSPIEQNLYVIKFDGTGKLQLDKKPGRNDAEFTKNFKYFISTWSDINTPPVITLCDNKGKELRVIESNIELTEKLKLYNLQRTEFFKFITSGDLELNGWMLKPPDFDTTKKYPVFMYVYGGPNSQSVLNMWGHTMGIWYQYLAQKGYIVATVDGRGSGGRGEEFRKCTYLQLGKYELEDQVEAAKYLGSLPYVDAARIGIWGWSYGGFMTALCLTKGNGIFEVGVAVAPVTNWRYYDNIYTERFMRTPKENPEGYDQNSPLNFAKSFQGKLLLIHGTADDNVHVQNSMEFAKALTNENKQFEMQYYTDKDHGIRGGKTRLHLFTRITEFILKNL